MGSRLTCWAVVGWLWGIPLGGQAQDAAPDTLPDRELQPIEVRTRASFGGFGPASAAAGWLLGGVKSESIRLDSLDHTPADKLARQVLAKVPGLAVYDLDGTGNQVNIAVRGLDPHRGWELNQRVDGLLANSDPFGYPASHLSLPWEAIERIELVRGTAALQYGSQLGGMLNYHTRRPPQRPLGLDAVSSVGSFGLVSTYLGAGGQRGRWQYQGYVSRRTSTGFRTNSRSQSDAQGLSLGLTINPKLQLDASWHHSTYRYQLPGPLTDAQFAANRRQATRQRNYYSPDIHLLGVRLGWQPSPRTHLGMIASGLLGRRSSVLFDRPATVPDTIDRQTGTYSPRQVDIDRYRSVMLEGRLTHRYPLLADTAQLLVGFQYLDCRMNRWQQGRGTTGSDYDLTRTEGGWGREVRMPTRNGAAFVQHRFGLWRRLGLTPGLRYEQGRSELSWAMRNYPEHTLPTALDRQYLLLGVSADLPLGRWGEVYGGWSQSYRPVLLKEWIPTSTFERVDPGLRDGRGSNAEIGWRGQAGDWQWDVTAFVLEYRNRIGTLVSPDGGTFELLRTNVGASRTLGLEVYAERQVRFGRRLLLNCFTATAWMDARYTSGELRQADGRNATLRGRRLEGVSEWTSRNGLRVQWGPVSGTLQVSTVSGHYADPFNTREPNASGTVGWVPAYTLIDFNASWRLGPNWVLQGAVNNLTDRAYFTKRPTFYPGPGIWPSDGRGFTLTIRYRL